LKTYRPANALLADIKGVLAARQFGSHRSPLDLVIERLCQGRHYSWVGIYLAAPEHNTRQLLGSGNDAHPGTALPETRSKILVSMRLAGREVGVFDVESDRESAFGAEDRVLLENVAQLLALFLSGRGKYLARKARENYAAGKTS